MTIENEFFNKSLSLELKKNDVIRNGNNKYIVLDYLGGGTFADVYKIEDLYSNNQFAIKIFKRGTCYFKVGFNEAYLMKKLRKHAKHFVAFNEEFFFSRHFCILQQLLANNLYEVIKYTNKQGFDHTSTKTITKQVLEALKVLHTEGITHGDIKPENICIESPTNGKTFRVKIIDLGSSFLHPRKNAFYIQSRYYRAPETILGLNYGRSIDLWSLGCLVFELFVGTPLFPGKNNKEQIMRYTKLLGIPPTILLENGKNTQLYFYKNEDSKNKNGGSNWHNFYNKDEDSYGIINNKENKIMMWENKAGFGDLSKGENFPRRKRQNVDENSLSLPKFKKQIHSKSSEKMENLSLIDFILQILKFNPIERPFIHDLLEHPYLQETKIIFSEFQNTAKAKRNIVNPLPSEPVSRRKSVYDLKSLRAPNFTERKFSVFGELEESEEN